MTVVWLIVVVFGAAVVGLMLLGFAALVVEGRNRRRHARRRGPLHVAESTHAGRPHRHLLEDGLSERPAGRRP